MWWHDCDFGSRSVKGSIICPARGCRCPKVECTYKTPHLRGFLKLGWNDRSAVPLGGKLFGRKSGGGGGLIALGRQWCRAGAAAGLPWCCGAGAARWC